MRLLFRLKLHNVLNLMDHEIFRIHIFFFYFIILNFPFILNMNIFFYHFFKSFLILFNFLDSQKKKNDQIEEEKPNYLKNKH